MSWKTLNENLVEHKNGNWVWKVGKEYEVWFKTGVTRMYAGNAGTKETALKIASENMREALQSRVVFQTLDRWLEQYESQRGMVQGEVRGSARARKGFPQECGAEKE